MQSTMTSTLKWMMSLVLASLVMTSLVEGACYQKPLSIDASAAASPQAGLSVYCDYEGQRKQLFTAWVDVAACTRCFCAPAGMQCCGLGNVPGILGCQDRN